MSVDKVILRAFLSTLAAIGVLLVFMVGALCAVFPSTMMEMTYDLGMESASIHFAERAYDSSEDIYYIAHATETAIQKENATKIVACGERFIQDTDFPKFCGEKGEDYRQFIYGQVCISKYESGAKAEALALACQAIDEGRFPQNNALIAVLVTSFAHEDAATVQAVKDKLLTLRAEGEEGAYLQETLSAIE